MKKLLLFISLLFGSAYTTLAQDIVVKKNGDVLRATILGTDFMSVRYSVNEAAPVISGLKDVKEFVWNGETYITKTFFGSKKAVDRFVRIVETGIVNLYSIGGTLSTENAPEPVRKGPRISVGLGTGGGSGVGGGVNFGRQNTPQSNLPKQVKTSYFIEKPGSGPILELNLENMTGLRSILQQKLGDDERIASRIKTLTELDGKELIALIATYNAAKVTP